MVIICFLRWEFLNLLQSTPFDKPKYPTPTSRVSETQPWLSGGGGEPRLFLRLTRVTEPQNLDSFFCRALLSLNCIINIISCFLISNYETTPLTVFLITFLSTPSSYPQREGSDMPPLGRNVLQLRTTGRAHLLITFTHCSFTFSLTCFLLSKFLKVISEPQFPS